MRNFAIAFCLLCVTPTLARGQDRYPIVGTWVQVFRLPGTDAEYRTYFVFKADNTGYRRDWDNLNGYMKPDFVPLFWSRVDGNYHYIVTADDGTSHESLTDQAKHKSRDVPLTIFIETNENRMRIRNVGTANADDEHFNRVR